MDLINGRRIRCVGLLAVIAILSACGDDGNSTAPADPEGPDGLSATLEIITTNITTAIGDRDFEPAEAGQMLVIGDRVRTDDTGFAEIDYHDGSWQRVENNATLTVLDLAEDSNSQVVRTGVDIGRTWNRVRALTEAEDTYELDTPVATAGVRGTAFATDCPTERECTFTVTEGTITITPDTGEPFELTAISTVTVFAGEPPPAPERLDPDDVLDDPWIATNLELDRERGAPPLQDDPDDTANDDTDEGALDDDAPCRTNGTVGELTLDDVPTRLMGGSEPEPGTGRGFIFEIDMPDEQTQRYSGSIVLGFDLPDVPELQTVDFSRSGFDSEFTEWFASSGRPDHDILISGEPLVGARVTGNLYESGNETAPTLTVDLTVTCEAGLTGEAPTTGPAFAPDVPSPEAGATVG